MIKAQMMKSQLSFTVGGLTSPSIAIDLTGIDTLT